MNTNYQCFCGKPLFQIEGHPINPIGALECLDCATLQIGNRALLRESLRDIMKLIDDQILVRNTDSDGDMRAFLQQAGTITRVLKSAQEALALAQNSPTPAKAR